MGVIGAALIIDSISDMPSLLARLRKWNDWLHSHLSSQLGGLIGGVLLGLTLALLFVQLYLWHRATGSTVHKKLAGFAFLGAIGSALLIALPFFSAEKDKTPGGPEADIHAIGENQVVVAATGGHEKAFAPSRHPKSGSGSGSPEVVSDVEPTELGGPAAEASSTECGCSSRPFVKQEPKMGQWKQPAPAPRPESQPTEEFFAEESGQEPEEEEEFFGSEEEEFEATGSPSTVSSSSSSSSSSVTVTSSNSSVSVNSTGGGSETVVTSTSESSSVE